MADNLLKTPLYDAHVRLGARIVPFAGYEMPVQFPAGIMEEHKHTRTACSVFDVSHMGQVQLTGVPSLEILKALESFTPSNLQELPKGSIKYSVLLNATGGVVDDLMITNPIESSDRVDLVINASRVAVDLEFLRAHLPAHITITHLQDRALIAVQGPKAVAAVISLLPSPLAGEGGAERRMRGFLDSNVSDPSPVPSGHPLPQGERGLPTKFMTAAPVILLNIPCYIARSGYTGEDGFEISVPADKATALYESLLTIDGVKPAGLGARDTLRLEAGLCLYGQDLDESISPVEADIRFIIGKRRRIEGSFNGAVRIVQEWNEKPKRVRVGLLVEGRAPARSHALVFMGEHQVGEISSGSFSPTLDAPIAFAYISPEYAAIGTSLEIDLRGRRIAATVTALPFTPHHYVK